MRILLLPDNTANDKSLANLYERAISEAIELFIVTAFLTDWQPHSVIRADCEELSFIVGTDFGITSKDACQLVMKWLPERLKNDFLAADRISGFHPKLILWKTKKRDFNLILGSSNLTQAAFNSNHEANVFARISEEQYNSIKEWVYSIRLRCSPISDDWLEGYKEATRPAYPRQGSKPPVISFKLPRGKDIDAVVKERRGQQRAFLQIEEQLSCLIELCAAGRLSDAKFYEKLMSLWGSNESRFQGRGFEILGKHSKWRQTCRSLSTIRAKAYTLSTGALDNLVKREMDRLTALQNPNRVAWLSEMLCHFFPGKYPILNKPVRVWLQHNKYRGPRGATEGARYIDLAIKLRSALENNTANRAKDLAQLDLAIWKWYDNEFGED
ncbi:MAG: phospholipase D family protein [Ignavibacteriales bacterium]|nr:phospholipase D family protein [Ignavibacteriales bacterium]